jgi:hypothetical protein
MTDLQRLTTQFVDNEDRIRLSGENADGEVQVLWLTRRLLDRLVPVLCEQLAPGADTHAGLLSSFKQEAAQSQLAPQEPVQATSAGTEALVTRIDMVRVEHGLRLTFFAQDSEAAAIVMPELSLRQWLAILRDQFRIAGWPENVWPAWTDPGATPDADAAPRWH